MTTGNKVLIKTINDAVFIPIEAVQTGTDSIPFVYTKNKTKQIVIPGDSNEKNIVIEQGLNPGQVVYLMQPENVDGFRLEGEELKSIIKENIVSKN
jgi:hypothetical protein